MSLQLASAAPQRYAIHASRLPRMHPLSCEPCSLSCTPGHALERLPSCPCRCACSPTSCVAWLRRRTCWRASTLTLWESGTQPSLTSRSEALHMRVHACVHVCACACVRVLACARACMSAPLLKKGLLVLQPFNQGCVAASLRLMPAPACACTCPARRCAASLAMAAHAMGCPPDTLDRHPLHVKPVRPCYGLP